jgi:hypothetical protein
VRPDCADVERPCALRLICLTHGLPTRTIHTGWSSRGTKIAATVWNEPAYEQNQDAHFDKVDAGHGFVLVCKSFDKGAVSDSRDKHRNKAGERHQSVKDMAPGQ